MPLVKMFNAALDEAEDSPAGIVLRGGLDLNTIEDLYVDDYQRDEQKYSGQTKIISALNAGVRLPDIELGMRGQDYRSSTDTDFALRSYVYIIDGLQRVSTIKEWMRQHPDKKVSLGAIVHFNTTKDWEKDRFHKLNNWRKRLSPNVLLRNMRDKNKAVLTLYGLTHNDDQFPLVNRVSWEQNMKRTELVTALVLLKVANRLHSHIALPTRGVDKQPSRGGATIEDISFTLQRRAEKIGLNVMRENVKAFFRAIEEMWGITSITFKDQAPHIKGTFLMTLAKLMSDKKDFWAGDKLFISLPIKRKLQSFPLNDPTVKNLTGSGGKALDLLYAMIRDHINSGKRTHRLRDREVA